MPPSLDPEYFRAIEPLLPALTSAPKPAVGDVASRRAGIDALFNALSGSIPDIHDVERTVHHTKANDGVDIPIYRFAKTGAAASTTPGPAIVYTHGGGYICLNVEIYTKMIEEKASHSGIQFFAVDYRLAPEAPFPTPVEDCYSALLWVLQHTKDFNIDPARVAIMGDSAGGGLAAAVALLARDRALSPPLAKQILIYPMLDDRNQVPIATIEPFATWSNNDNITGWSAYAGAGAGKDHVSPYAAPARVESVEGLPSAYVDVGELDIFRDENIAYASRLFAAGISTELHVYPGVPHAFEVFAPATSVATRARENRLKAMLSF